MTTLTPARIAALRAKNAARATTDWPDRYLVDELLDEIERLRGALTTLAKHQPGYWDGDNYCCTYCEESTQPTEHVDRDLTNALIESYHDPECPWLAARRVLRGEAPDA